MTDYWLCFCLVSEATFGSGEGRAGEVDLDVAHDRYGLPYLGGRSLKGLLVEACADILYPLSQQGNLAGRWYDSATALYGTSGANADGAAGLAVGDARLPDDLCAAVAYAVDAPDSHLTASDVLESLCAVRSQTAVDPLTGAASEGSLRSMRVILRGTRFEAPLGFATPPTDTTLGLLAACVLMMRRAGVARNRGRGRLMAELFDDSNGRPADKPCTDKWFRHYRQEVEACMH